MGRLLWTLHSESKNSISVLPSTKQLAISSSGSNSHADTPFSCIARNCESEMSVGKVSGGLAWMKAITRVLVTADGDSYGKTGYMIPFALRYSIRCRSSMFSKASASSLASACSSSYSPGLPMRSRMIRPRLVYLKK